jgi:HPt (histidine-containing phosphotransfer) domain-containing protein
MKIPTSSERIDLRDMRRRLGDDDALIADLFEMFLEDTGLRLATIRTAVDERRLDTVRRAAHALKGSAGNVSAFAVVDAAAALEHVAERGEADSLDHRFAKVTREVELLIAELRQTAPENG